MRREGVVLRTWRVGGDVLDECVGLCKRVLREMQVGKGEGEGEAEGQGRENGKGRARRGDVDER